MGCPVGAAAPSLFRISPNVFSIARCTLSCSFWIFTISFVAATLAELRAAFDAVIALSVAGVLTLLIGVAGLAGAAGVAVALAAGAAGATAAFAAAGACGRAVLLYPLSYLWPAGYLASHQPLGHCRLRLYQLRYYRAKVKV